MNLPTNRPVIPSPLTADRIQDWLASRLAHQLGLDPSDLDHHTPLVDYGLNSAQALSLIGEGEKILGCEISPMLLWHYPTLAALSERLAEEVNEAEVETFEL
ncbi:MAG: acyl carrier protein [Elainellaceae cyanobacterium]